MVIHKQEKRFRDILNSRVERSTERERGLVDSDSARVKRTKRTNKHWDVLETILMRRRCLSAAPGLDTGHLDKALSQRNLSSYETI